MDAKPFIIIFSTSLGLIVVGAIVGNALEAMGAISKESVGPKWTAVILSVFFALFCLTAFSFVPLALKAFITMQLKIGNGGHFLVKWLRGNERAVVCGFWGLALAGLAIAFVLARDEILKQFK